MRHHAWCAHTYIFVYLCASPQEHCRAVLPCCRSGRSQNCRSYDALAATLFELNYKKSVIIYTLHIKYFTSNHIALLVTQQQMY